MEKRNAKYQTITYVSLVSLFLFILFIVIPFLGTEFLRNEIVTILNASGAGDLAQHLIYILRVDAIISVMAMSIIYSLAIILVYRYIIRPLLLVASEARDVISKEDVHFTVTPTIPEIRILRKLFESIGSSQMLKNQKVDIQIQAELTKSKELLLATEEQNVELEKSRSAIVNILSDLNEERDSLLHLSAKNEAILKSITDGVIVLDINNRVVLFNKTAEEITGLNASRAIDKVWPEVFGKGVVLDEKGKEFELEQLLWVAGEDEAVEIYNPPLVTFVQNSYKRIVLVTISTVRVDSVCVGAVVVLRDVTEEKRVEPAMSKNLAFQERG
ncbi:MAG: PAS domain S-box protein [bacterium]|nr:PAS domain S-box protein [bacterium]